MQITKPFILGIPTEQRWFCFPIKTHIQAESKKKKVPLSVFESFETRPVLPIFNTEKECMRFRNEIMSRYHTHISDWEIFHIPDEYHSLPKRCVSVYVENTLQPAKKPDSIMFQSRPVSFDFKDEKLISYMGLYAYMGFLVVTSFCIENHILSINGLFVDSSYDNLQSEQHVHYLRDNLKNLV
jgi:hypothetical protein